MRKAGVRWRAATAVAVLVMSGCGILEEADDAVDPASVGSVEVDLEHVHPDRELTYVPVVLGDVLVSTEQRTQEDGFREGPGLVTSSGRGESWEPAALPGQPSDLEELSLHGLGDVVAVSAEGPVEWSGRERRYPSLYLWVSLDGKAWQGGRVAAPPPGERPTEVRGAWRLADNRLVVRLHTRGRDEESFIASADEGQTWRPLECPEDDPDQGECREAPPVGELWVDDRQAVSFDEGRSWQDTDFPFVDDDKIVSLAAVERTDGGWLGRAASAEDDGSDSWDQSYLVRSNDGLRWERVFGRDSRCWKGFPGEWISNPVQLGSRWLVAYVCDNPEEGWPGPRLSQLYLVDAEGTEVVAVDGSDQSDAFYDQPIPVGDSVVVPVLTFREGDISLLWLDPPKG